MVRSIGNMVSYASLQYPFINKGNLQVHGPYGFSHNLPTCMDDASIGIINYENIAGSYKCFQELSTQLRCFVEVVDTLLFLGTSCTTSEFFVYQNHSFFCYENSNSTV